MAFNYQETRITFTASDVPDLYAIHQRVMVVTDGDKAITYAPLGVDRERRMAVVLRSMPGVSMPGTDRQGDDMAADQKAVDDGMTFKVNAGIRLVKRSDGGERMPTVDEAVAKWNAALLAGGFVASNTRMVESNIAFYHKRLCQQTRLPFWAVSGTLTAVDAEKAAETMVRGIGRSRGLGFGMLQVVAS